MNYSKLPLIATVSCISFYIFTSFSPTESRTPLPVVLKSKSSTDTVFTLLFGGDMMGHMSMINTAYNDSTRQYEYDPWFQFISPYINSCTWAVANLEVTLAGPPYSGYPQFSSPDVYPLAIKNAGFDALVNANNHSQDKGQRGLERTIAVLDSIHMPHTGTFTDTAEFDRNYPLMVTVAGSKIAILNYTYGTNGLSVIHPNIVNVIDSVRMTEALAKAKSLGADMIIPVLHWGTEYQIKESDEQRLTANLLASNGASAIIGMHPHVVQPIKTIKVANGQVDSVSVPVAYSLGNFVSSQTDRHCDGGIMVRLTCMRKNDKVSIAKWDYLPFWVWRLKAEDISSGLRKGFYMITEKQLPLLHGGDSLKAVTFFQDTRENLSGTSEWK